MYIYVRCISTRMKLRTDYVYYTFMRLIYYSESQYTLSVYRGGSDTPILHTVNPSCAACLYL